MKSKRKQFLAFSLASIGAIGAFASVNAASIQAGTTTKTRDEAREAIKQAVNNGDYQAYLATTKDYKVGVPVLTEGQFRTMIQAGKLRAGGDKVGAKKLLDEAGIKAPKQNKKRLEGKNGDKREKAPLTEAQKTAIEKAKVLRKEGKKEEAKEVLNTAGIKKEGGKTRVNSKNRKFKNLEKENTKNTTATGTPAN